MSNRILKEDADRLELETADLILREGTVTVTDAGDEGFYDGQVGVVVTGTGFKASQSTGTLSLNSAADGSGTNVTQTVGITWTDTQITFTVTQGELDNGTAYLFIQNSDLLDCVSGLTITLGDRPTITDAGDEAYFNGQTGVVITGTGFGTQNGNCSVSLNAAVDGTGTNVAQTITAWTDTSITVTIVKGALSNGTNYFIVNNTSSINSTGYTITLGAQPTITDAGDEGFYHGQTGIVITGTGFGTQNSNCAVYLNSAAGGTGTNVVQTVTAWADTSITISVNQGSLSNGTNYLIVNNSSSINSAGYQVSVSARPTISAAGDGGFYNGQTGVVLTGTLFGYPQSSGTVSLNSARDGSGTNIAQTVTNWASDTSITFTVVKGALSYGTCYLIVNSATLIDTDGFPVTLGTRPTITDAGDEAFYSGQTGVVITGTGFGTVQAAGGVSLNAAQNGSGTGVNQVVTAWADTSITVTINKGALSTGTNYLIVNNSNSIDSDGYQVALAAQPIISDAGDKGFYNGETVVVTGTNFLATHVTGTVKLNSAADGTGTSVTQTVNSWGDTSINITVVKGALSLGPAYLLVSNDNHVESAGLAVTLGTTPAISSTSTGPFSHGQTGIQINGTDFGNAPQGKGSVTLHYLSAGTDTGIVQTVTTWGDTQIIITLNQGSLPAGTAYFFVTTNAQLISAGYSVTLTQKTATTIADDWNIDYVPNSPLTITHDDGTLFYDTGGGTAPARDAFIRGATSGAVAQILTITGTAAAGFMELTSVTARFQDNESLVWLDSIGFDTVTNSGFTVGNTITGASSGRTGVVRFIDYYGTYGYAYSETFGTGTWTDNENIQVGGQTRAQAYGVGAYNHSTWTGVLANGTLTTSSITGLLNFDTGTQLVPIDALVQGGTSNATGVVHLQFGSTATGSLRLNDVSGTWQDNENLVITQVVNYNTLQAGQKFRTGDWVVGGTSGATGRVLTLIDDGDATGRIILASQTGTFNSGSHEDLNVAGVKIAQVENGTFTLTAAVVNGTLKTTQRVSQGGLYTNSLNPIRSMNFFYTYLQDTFDELDQLDDLTPMSGQVKNQQYTLTNSWRLPDLSLRFFDSGSIQDESLVNIWTNYQTLGTLQSVGDLAYGAVAPEPQLYAVQNNQLVSPFWIQGHLNLLIKVKTTTTSTTDSNEGQLIQNGTVTIFARRYGFTYDHYQTTSAGGVAYIPLSTASDLNNPTGTHQLAYQSESGGTLVAGEEISTADGTKVGIIVTISDTNPTGTLTYTLTSASNFANTNTFTGAYSGASAQVNGAPTNLVAGYTDITFAFAGSSHDLGNSNGLRPYDCVVNCNFRPLIQVYEYLKYVTRAGSTTTLNGYSGDLYVAVGDIRLLYDGQTGNFTEGLTVTGATSQATGVITADHDAGAIGALIMRQVSGTFTDNETLTDTGTGSAAVNGAGEIIAPVKASPFGTLAGGRFFGARGIFLSNVYSADANNYELIDSEGVRQVPPVSITLTVNGLVAGDEVAVFQSIGAGLTAVNKSQYNIQASQSMGVAYIRVTQSIPNDTPATGFIRVVRRDGAGGTGDMLGEERYAYSSWNNNDQSTFSTFVVSATTQAYGTTDTAYVGYIDDAASGSSLAASFIYVSDRTMVTRLRRTGILPYEVTGTITNVNQTITPVRATDSIA